MPVPREVVDDRRRHVLGEQTVALPGGVPEVPVAAVPEQRVVRGRGDGFKGGKILDPDSGKIYNCKMEVVNGGKVLNVRGSLDRWGLAGRTQKWLKEN